MMELGATICTPKKTLCIMCPVQKHCYAFANGVVENYQLKRKIKKRQLTLTYYISRIVLRDISTPKRYEIIEWHVGISNV